MKTISSHIRRYAFSTRVAVFALAGTTQVAEAGFIPYPNVGTINPDVYTFTATADGAIDAYFAGKGGASYTETLGMEVNGVVVSSGLLVNQSTPVGTEAVLGNVHAGDVLTFFIDVANLGGARAYSDPSLNAAFDSYYSSSPGVNHVYSTSYTQGSIAGFGAIPTGTYVGFEDLPASNPPDYNYADEQYVFTDVSMAVPEPTTVITGALMAIPFGFQGLRFLRNRKQAA